MPSTWDAEEARLRAAAVELRHQLDLDRALSPIGEPTLVGSAALRLLVARDLDITVTVERLEDAAVERIADLARSMVPRSDVIEVVMLKDTGRWNTDPRYPDGVYLRLTCVDRTDARWTVDLWFVDDPDRQPDLAHFRDLAPRISPAVQSEILRIKRAGPWHRVDGARIPSIEVYRAVLDADVADPDGYREYLIDRGLLGPSPA